MRQKSVLLFAASWLVVRLRLALLSSRLVLREALHAPQVLLVTRRQDPHHFGNWFANDARLHYLFQHEEEPRVQVRAFPVFEKN